MKKEECCKKSKLVFVNNINRQGCENLEIFCTTCGTSFDFERLD